MSVSLPNISLPPRKIGLGLIGAGDFGLFCLKHYAAMDGVSAVAIGSRSPERAAEHASQFGAVACSYDELFARDDVDLVHIATPPFTHGELALRALAAGKHVLCEKPLATRRDEAQAMIDAARRHKRLLAVNLIMRYAPLNQSVARILERQYLGAPLHAVLENYAGDDKLTADHWFWDRELSGGILVEHGVHFFDLFAMWFGEGQVASAQRTIRPGSDELVEQVQATVVYSEGSSAEQGDRAAPGVIADFYHGFWNASRLDRQEIRIVCERGDIRLYDWVPTRIEIDAILTRDVADAIAREIPSGCVKLLDAYARSDRAVAGRHKSFKVDGRYRIRGDTGMSKQDVYRFVVQQLLLDQLRRLDNPRHASRITESNGVSSLAMALEANALAGEAPRA